MGNNIKERGLDIHTTKNVFIGLLIGGLAGAATMLFFAPRSGKQTRAKIQSKSLQWRDWTTGLVRNTLAHIRSDTRAVTADIR